MWVVARVVLDACGASWIRRQKLFSAMSGCGGSGTILMTPGSELSYTLVPWLSLMGPSLCEQLYLYCPSLLAKGMYMLMTHLPQWGERV